MRILCFILLILFVVSCAKDTFPDGVSQNCNCEVHDLEYVFMSIAFDSHLHDEWSTLEIDGQFDNPSSFVFTAKFVLHSNSELRISIFNPDGSPIQVGQVYDLSQPYATVEMRRNLDGETRWFNTNVSGDLTIIKVNQQEKYLSARFNWNAKDPSLEHFADVIWGRVWFQEQH